MVSSAHISISTADHEFFGVSMVEAAQVGCYCLVPNRLRNVFNDLSFRYFTKRTKVAIGRSFLVGGSYGILYTVYSLYIEQGLARPKSKSTTKRTKAILKYFLKNFGIIQRLN